ncbi:MoaD/ThiS family protein [Teredinibacter purpureus]|uniref:MoaD/ThiS family protein n=1 Tax=Teredinibacter purpureus TaxID=2731756 RepID=UPI0005F7867C|nr:MoaD/ThiS family protein [Teredinibacter purpureus]
MPITVNIPTILQPLTQHKKRITANGKTVNEIIDDIDIHYPGIKNRVIAEGKVHRFMNIYVNDNDIRFTENLRTTISENDSLTILPAVAGG